MKTFTRNLCCRSCGISALLFLLACSSQLNNNGFDADRFLSKGDKYTVTIHRDIWGVPHIVGKSNPDAAFGLAYAQAEDDWQNIQAGIPVYRGNNALYVGQDGAKTDYLVQLLRIWPNIEANYQTALSPETQAYLSAFADGLNYWAAKHADKVDQTLFPITAKDLVAAYSFQHLLFYGFEGELTKLFEAPEPLQTAMGSVAHEGIPVGSNAFAVSPINTPDKATRLVINSHQPLTGPVAWYEAHIKSDEGLNFMGGTFPGSATFGLGFNEHLAWGVTVNKPDLVDVYKLVINPENEFQYRLDGEWLDLERDLAHIPVNLFLGFTWTFEEDLLRSNHGPVIRTETGTYAIRYAGMDEIRQPEQWHRMNKATTLAEWQAAMAMQSFASFNFVYADKTGNISFVHNSLTPIRKPGFNWQAYLPGDDSTLIWDQYLAYQELPQITNPASGYLHSANQSPFQVSAPGSNPEASPYRPEHGFPTRMTNRAYRGLELFAELSPISQEDMEVIKYDNAYSRQSRSYKYIAALFALDLSATPRLQAGQKLLRLWDLHSDYENQQTALGVCVLAPEWSAEQKGVAPPPALDELSRCVDLLTDKFGRIDPPWASVNRLVRGDFDQPIQGAPDVLRAVYGVGLEEDGRLTDVGGDGLFYFVQWNSAGELTVSGVHQFGSATQDDQSPHYADQSSLFVNQKTKSVFYNFIDLQNNLERSYRPQDG